MLQIYCWVQHNFFLKHHCFSKLWKNVEWHVFMAHSVYFVYTVRNKYYYDDQITASVGLRKGTQTFKMLNCSQLRQVLPNASKLVWAMFSALVSTIILPVQRDSSAGFSYRRQPRRMSGHLTASITIPFTEAVQVIMISLISGHKCAVYLICWISVLFSTEKVRLL